MSDGAPQRCFAFNSTSSRFKISVNHLLEKYFSLQATQLLKITSVTIVTDVCVVFCVSCMRAALHDDVCGSMGSFLNDFFIY